VRETTKQQRRECSIKVPHERRLRDESH